MLGSHAPDILAWIPKLLFLSFRWALLFDLLPWNQCPLTHNVIVIIIVNALTRPAWVFLNDMA